MQVLATSMYEICMFLLSLAFLETTGHVSIKL